MSTTHQEGSTAREVALETAIKQALGILYPKCGTAAGAEASLDRALDVLRRALKGDADVG